MTSSWHHDIKPTHNAKHRSPLVWNEMGRTWHDIHRTFVQVHFMQHLATLVAQLNVFEVPDLPVGWDTERKLEICACRSACLPFVPFLFYLSRSKMVPWMYLLMEMDGNGWTWMKHDGNGWNMMKPKLLKDPKGVVNSQVYHETFMVHTDHSVIV
jgi:hypothetical protein